MTQWITKPPVRILFELNDRSIISDNETLYNSEQKKSEILRGELDKVVFTEDGSFHLVGENEKTNPLCNTSIFINSNKEIRLDLDHIPVDTEKEVLIESAREFVSNYLETIENQYEGIILEIDDISIKSMNNKVHPFSEMGRPSISHPTLPAWAISCPDHGLRFKFGSYFDKEFTNIFASGYARSNDRDLPDGFSSWYEYIHKEPFSDMTLELVPNMYKTLSDRIKCCDKAIATYEIETKSEAEDVQEDILQYLFKETEHLHDKIINPFDEISFPSTNELLPFFYMYDDKGVKFWNKIHTELFISLESETPFVLNPTNIQKELVEDIEISEIEYIRMLYDLIGLMKFSYPRTETEAQNEKIKQAYTSLGYGDSVFESSERNAVWMMDNPMGSDILGFLSDQEESFGATITDSFRDYNNIGFNFDIDDFDYEENNLMDVSIGELLKVPIDSFGRHNYNLDISVIARIESYNYVPQVSGEILSEIISGWNNNEPNLPKGYWLNPIGLALKQNQEYNLIDLYNIGIEFDNNDKDSWVPATKDMLYNSERIKSRVPPKDTSDLISKIGMSINIDNLDQIKNYKTVENIDLSLISEFLIENKEEFSIDPREVSLSPGGLNKENYFGWYTLITVGEYPIKVNGCDYIEDLESRFISSYVNHVNGENSHIRGYIPVWSKLIGTENAESENFNVDDIPNMLLEDYSLEDSASIIPIPIVLLSEEQIETS